MDIQTSLKKGSRGVKGFKGLGGSCTGRNERTFQPLGHSNKINTITNKVMKHRCGKQHLENPLRFRSTRESKRKIKITTTGFSLYREDFTLGRKQNGIFFFRGVFRKHECHGFGQRVCCCRDEKGLL